MEEATSIRILEKDNNRRGDLFGRLMADLFVALGYEQPHLNIHKSGRELDLAAEHRLEPRLAVAECKATADPIGGDDINKFVGALDAEKKSKRPVTAGYFISLSGFRETALEQERLGRRTKIITLAGPQVVEELVKGRILIAKDRATEMAGRCCSALGYLTLDPKVELLAHERGWIWAVFYTHGKDRTHFVLIHSDGTPLARALADEVIAADRACNGTLHELSCLNPAPSPAEDSVQQVQSALAAYGQYLANECGYIQLDGLPADSDVGSRRLRLENQKISRPRLASLLQEARDALPTELGYVKGTVDQFIHRVEDRSSLLMMTGHDVEDGRLVEFFEFRHLTFQEFLTARAMVEGWHPGREENDTLASVLEPHLEKEEWR